MSLEPHHRQLHIYFLPVMAPGHMIPIIEIARKFAKHGVKSTIITTPLNANQFSKTIDQDRENGIPISISLVKFPSEESGLPDGCENLSTITTPQMTLNFLKAFDLLQEPVEHLLREGQADCLIAGAFFWWANDVALKLNIPRISFYGTGFFSMCIHQILREHKPHDKVESEDEEFVVPGLPDPIKLSRRQLSDRLKKEDDGPMGEFIKKVLGSDSTIYGMIVNSFCELEPAYANHYREVIGRKAWSIGPVSLFNKRDGDGDGDGARKHECFNWLDSKKPNSVVYVCFGSMAILQTPQLHEIAKGLEASGHNFLWVVRENTKENKSDRIPEGFEERMAAEGRGFIIKGWAPQVAILGHEAVGGFVTHCGWNSLLEGVAAGVPMVTWPLSAEQFSNEKLVVEILKTGVPVGVEEWRERTDERESVKREKIEKAVDRLMVGEEAAEMRSRARRFGESAKRAVEIGGSSDDEFRSLLQELEAYRPLTTDR